jgi:hypothetical protein
MSIFAAERPDPRMTEDPLAQYPHPRLIFFGFLNQPFVYKAITEMGVLATAKALGFNGVEFTDRGDEGRWFFDISGQQIPKCDVHKRLCV